MLFAILATKKWHLKDYSKEQWDKNGMRLATMIMKEKAKEEFGIKSLKELSTKEKLKKFEAFLERKIYE